MTRFEYAVMAFNYGDHREFTFAGSSVIAASRGEAKVMFRAQVDSQMVDLRAVRDEQLKEKLAYECALEAWSGKREEALAGATIEKVEEEVRKMGRYLITREQVTMPDGTRRMFEPGKGREFLDEIADAAAGPPPTPPEPVEILSDSELVEHVLQGMAEAKVGRWSGTIQPADPSFDGSPRPGDLQRRVVEELNRLGAQGWSVVDVSEDRAISAGDSGTSTTVVGVRYTLVREARA